MSSTRPSIPYVQLLIDSVPVPDPTDKWDVNISPAQRRGDAHGRVGRLPLLSALSRIA